MRTFLRRYKKYLLTVLSLALIFLIGTGIGFSVEHLWSENGKFEAFTRQIFEKEVSESILTLHYSLSHPEKKGISRPAPTLGTVTSDMSDTYRLYEGYLKKLKGFSSEKLSRENQITLDMLLLYFHTQLSLKDHVLL